MRKLSLNGKQEESDILTDLLYLLLNKLLNQLLFLLQVEVILVNYLGLVKSRPTYFYE